MDFKERLQTITRDGSLALAVLMAKELGIFEALRSSDLPLTSQQLASERQLKERFVRELLGCLTSASLVQISPESAGQLAYYLTEEAKTIVKSSPSYIDIDLIGLMASMYPELKAFFRLDGPSGRSYREDICNYLDERGNVSDDGIIRSMLDNVPGLKTKLDRGINALEIGSGSGHLVSRLATRFPNSTFTASEVSDAFVARIQAKCGHIANIRFQTIDLCRTTELPSTRFDWVLAVNVLHHLAHPLVGLRNARRLVDVGDEEESNGGGNGGCVTFLDSVVAGGHRSTVGNAPVAFQYASSIFFCLPEICQVEGSEAHGPCWTQDTVLAMLGQAGFLDVLSVKVDEMDVLYIGACHSHRK